MSESIVKLLIAAGGGAVVVWWLMRHHDSGTPCGCSGSTGVTPGDTALNGVSMTAAGQSATVYGAPAFAGVLVPSIAPPPTSPGPPPLTAGMLQTAQTNRNALRPVQPAPASPIVATPQTLGGVIVRPHAAIPDPG